MHPPHHMYLNMPNYGTRGYLEVFDSKMKCKVGEIRVFLYSFFNFFLINDFES